MKILLLCLMLSLVAGCGSGADPIARELNKLGDIEVDYFDVGVEGFNDVDIQSGDVVELDWSASGATFFDVKFYLSDDNRQSSDDFLIISEDCNDVFDKCQNNTDIEYECDYLNDNSFNCEYEDRNLRDNNITAFLDVLPKDAYIIIEVCNDGDCDTRARAVTFF